MTRRINGRLALLLATAGLLVLLLAGWYVLVSPQRSKAAALDNQIGVANAKLIETQAFLRSPAARESVAKLRTLRVALPDDVQMSDILRQLSWASGVSGVRIDSITPTAPVASPAGQAVPITLSVTGHYFRLAKFMHLLKTRVDVKDGNVKASGRLYAIDNISFSTAGTGSHDTAGSSSSPRSRHTTVTATRSASPGARGRTSVRSPSSTRPTAARCAAATGSSTRAPTRRSARSTHAPATSTRPATAPHTSAS